MNLSRRFFLSLSSGVAAGALIPGGVASAAKAVAGSVPTTIPHASHYGPFHAVVQNGRLTAVRPLAEKHDAMPTPMLTEGIIERTYDKTRVLYPMVRKSYLEGIETGTGTKPELRGKEPFVRVSWDVALGLTSKAILDTIDQYGNEGIFSSSYGGWSHSGIFRPNALQGRFFNIIGGSSMTTGDYSAGASQILLPFVIGDMEVYSAQTSWEQIRDNTEVFVFVGCDPFKNNRIEYTVADHQMYPRWTEIKKAGVKFISINPQVTPTDEALGSEWVKIIPNTDTALFLAMSYHVYKAGKHDKEFLKTHTVGADRFIQHLEGKGPDGVAKTPEWAAKITGIPAGKIRELAELMAAKRTEIAGAWALQRAHHGEMTHWAIINFACMTGKIGLPGQGVGFSWHYGSGGMPQSGAAMPAGLGQGRNPIKKICPASRISEMLLNPGKEFTYNGSTYTYPAKIDLVYNAGNNFMSHQQDTNELIRALQTVKTVVVQDPWWCASSRWADIVLPATSPVERDDVSSGGTYSNDKIFAMKKVIEPLGESLDDFEIFRRLAEIFGVEQAFTEGQTPLEIIQAAYEKSAAPIPFDEFWEKGIAEVPVPQEAHKWVRHGDFRNDPVKNPLHTKSGKVEMYCEAVAAFKLPDCPPMPTYMEPAEFLGNAKPGQVHVVSPHPFMRLHSQMANAESLRRGYAVAGREPLLISVEDAKEQGIVSGDVVELHNERGSVLAGAVVSDKIMKGVVSIQEGVWPQLDSKGRCNSGLVNFITSSRPSSGLNQATTANTCVAFLRKCTDAETPNQAYEPPPVLQREVALKEGFYGFDRAYGLAEKATANMEPGEKLFYQSCTVCHGPRDPAQFTQQQWQGITQSMFPRAGLDDDQQKIVMEFLLKNAKDAAQ